MTNYFSNFQLGKNNENFGGPRIFNYLLVDLTSNQSKVFLKIRWNFRSQSSDFLFSIYFELEPVRASDRTWLKIRRQRGGNKLKTSCEKIEHKR